MIVDDSNEEFLLRIQTEEPRERIEITLLNGYTLTAYGDGQIEIHDPLGDPMLDEHFLRLI